MLNKLGSKHRRDYGGAAMEYVVVSTFALLVAVGGVTFVGKLFKDKLQQITEKMGGDTPEFEMPELLDE